VKPGHAVRSLLFAVILAAVAGAPIAHAARDTSLPPSPSSVSQTFAELEYLLNLV
jgi:hypothetical protein